MFDDLDPFTFDPDDLDAAEVDEAIARLEERIALDLFELDAEIELHNRLHERKDQL